MALTQVLWRSRPRLTLPIWRNQYSWERRTRTGDKLLEFLMRWERRFLETHITTSEKIVTPLAMHWLRLCWAEKSQATSTEWPSWVESYWTLRTFSEWNPMMQNFKLHSKSKTSKNKMYSKVRPKESRLADCGKCFSDLNFHHLS